MSTKTNKEKIPSFPPPEKVLLKLSAFFPEQADKQLDLITNGVDTSPLAPWHQRLIVQFIRAAQANVMGLLWGYDQPDMYSLAFHARNLLELTIWIDYCGKSKANANRFVHDSFRDITGLGAAARQLLPPPIQKVQAERLRKMDREAATLLAPLGLSAHDHKFMQVSDAAKIIGATHFVGANKVLSKFAHPTAMMVVAMPKNKGAKPLKKMIVNQGASSAILCLIGTHDILKTHQYPVGSSTVYEDFFLSLWSVSPMTALIPKI